MRSARNIFQVAIACGALLFATGCGLDWRESYEFNDKDPFDLFVLHQLLEARDGGMIMLKDSLPVLSADEDEVANYCFVGSYAYYNERDITHLLDFVERGNNAFIAADELPEELAEMLYGSDCYFDYNDYYGYGSSTYYLDDAEKPRYTDTIRLTLETSSEPYELVNVYKFKPRVKRFASVPDGFLCDPEIDNVSIGTVDTSFIGYVRLNWGKGNFYFNTQPLFFTNYYLVDSTSYHYAEDALAIAFNDGPIYWDEASRVPPAVARQRREQRDRNAADRDLQGRNLLSGNESLSYIQNNPALALAWYLLLVSVLLYVFFRGKRRQRIIPIINQRENSSKRFIDTLSRLVFQKGNHGALARQELRSLRFFLRDKFNIRWQPSDPLPKDFGELTGASAALIERADIEIKLVHGKPFISETALVNFYRAIEPIYKL